MEPFTDPFFTQPIYSREVRSLMKKHSALFDTPPRYLNPPALNQRSDPFTALSIIEHAVPYPRSRGQLFSLSGQQYMNEFMNDLRGPFSGSLLQNRDYTLEEPYSFSSSLEYTASRNGENDLRQHTRARAEDTLGRHSRGEYRQMNENGHSRVQTRKRSGDDWDDFEKFYGGRIKNRSLFNDEWDKDTTYPSSTSQKFKNNKYGFKIKNYGEL